MEKGSRNRRSPKINNPAALERVSVAMARLPNILDRETVACQRTLEQKISDGGPNPQRVDPHLLGVALDELCNDRRFVVTHRHDSTGSTDWYANARTSENDVQAKLDEVAPLYARTTRGGFGNHVGDALEIHVFKSLQQLQSDRRRYSFQGSFDLTHLPENTGRYRKTEPPQSVSGNYTQKRADFILHGFDSGPICIECKNLREWVYPNQGIVKELITKALELDLTPLLVARRIQYSALANLFEPAGIIAHETYNQFYMPHHADIADQVKKVRGLGFSDVRATLDPQPRTLKFFNELLPRIADNMAAKFRANRQALEDFAGGGINLAQLYNAIGSPAAGN